MPTLRPSGGGLHACGSPMVFVYEEHNVLRTGEETIAKRSSEPKSIKLYAAWFCPFAQRAWIAMEELGIDYQVAARIYLNFKIQSRSRPLFYLLYDASRTRHAYASQHVVHRMRAVRGRLSHQGAAAHRRESRQDAWLHRVLPARPRPWVGVSRVSYRRQYRACATATIHLPVN